MTLNIRETEGVKGKAWIPNLKPATPAQVAMESNKAEALSVLPRSAHHWVPSHTCQDSLTARPGPNERNRTGPPPCGQRTLLQLGWVPAPVVHSREKHGQATLEVLLCPAAARIPPLPLTPDGGEERRGWIENVLFNQFTSVWNFFF